jgi:hypothetical protein
MLRTLSSKPRLFQGDGKGNMQTRGRTGCLSRGKHGTQSSEAELGQRGQEKHKRINGATCDNVTENDALHIREDVANDIIPELTARSRDGLVGCIIDTILQLVAFPKEGQVTRNASFLGTPVQKYFISVVSDLEYCNLLRPRGLPFKSSFGKAIWY